MPLKGGSSLEREMDSSTPRRTRNSRHCSKGESGVGIEADPKGTGALQPKAQTGGPLQQHGVAGSLRRAGKAMGVTSQQGPGCGHREGVTSFLRSLSSECRMGVRVKERSGWGQSKGPGTKRLMYLLGSKRASASYWQLRQPIRDFPDMQGDCDCSWGP